MVSVCIIFGIWFAGIFIWEIIKEKLFKLDEQDYELETKKEDESSNHNNCGWNVEK